MKSAPVGKLQAFADIFGLKCGSDSIKKKKKNGHCLIRNEMIKSSLKRLLIGIALMDKHKRRGAQGIKKGSTIMNR